MFRVSTTPIIRSTQYCNYSLRYCAAISLQHGQAWPRWREVAAWQVPGALVTVLCTPDDVCGWLPKHVEWTCRIINRLLCVASRWAIINIRVDSCVKYSRIKIIFIHLPMKMEPIVSSETSAIKSQTPGNYPKRNKLQKLYSFQKVLRQFDILYIYNIYIYIYTLYMCVSFSRWSILSDNLCNKIGI